MAGSSLQQTSVIDQGSQVIHSLLLDRGPVCDVPIPIAFTPVQYRGPSYHLLKTLIQALNDAYGVDIDVKEIRLWKPKEHLKPDVAIDQGWVSRATSEFHDWFSLIPFTQSLSDALDTTVAHNKSGIHLVVTTTTIYHRAGQEGASRMVGPPLRDQVPIIDVGVLEALSLPLGEGKSTVVQTSPLYLTPIVVLGFSSITSWGWYEKTAQFLTHAGSFTPTSFQVNTNNWTHTSGEFGVSWLRADRSSLLQGGIFSTNANSNSKTTSLISERVAFGPSFESPPRVFVSPSGFQFDGKAWDIRVFSTDVNRSGFKMNVVRSPEEGTLANIQVHWLAFPEGGLPGRQMCTGQFHISEVLDSSSPVKSGDVVFEQAFTISDSETPPRIFLAIDHIKASKAHTLRIWVSVSNVTSSGMEWKIQTADDTVIYSASVSYLAIA
ncbi:hypothetical protein CC1G_03185 [Coprinopsis cinerea okayama7|uniref:H-type lectin domain-containing protein n=1 Tax=Coprinopsis cinerea (strain Okayama-7 / 130 / ATCC MYA-4618 / FGSC 9003) TaxID=240176 RepID=A8PF85_COPC7|nr:hypothetical protein CC1G_03185 [Coprinopsis cinerea okayama7\|eukprot:XP_001840956.1 hypothetical protein CC1G_03185 [Coprinopsis cinerea okayama7\